jgi:hypothetical protein
MSEDMVEEAVRVLVGCLGDDFVLGNVTVMDLVIWKVVDIGVVIAVSPVFSL